MTPSRTFGLAAAFLLATAFLCSPAKAEPKMFSTPPAGAPDADQLAQDVNDRLTENMTDSKIDLEITLVNANGNKRVRKIKRFQKNYMQGDHMVTKYLMNVTSPADVRGTVFLSWEYEDVDRDDDRWLYLPSMKQTRRIAGSSKNDYFMGSDLTYDDLGKRPVKQDAHRIIGEEKILDGHDCWLLEAIPHKVEENDYVRLVTWVDKEHHIMRKRNYYDKDGLLKVQVADKIAKQNGVWSYLHVVVENKTNNHKTIVNESNHTYNTGVKDDMFRESVMQRGGR